MTLAAQDRPQNRTDLIESRIDKNETSKIQVGGNFGGVNFTNMLEMMEFAKLMAISGAGVPPHLRNQPGMCLAIILQAVEWKMSPYSVANKSYVVNDRVSYESQLIHAVVEQRCPLTRRLRDEYIGEGPTRQCKVIGYVKGEPEPLVYISPKFSEIKVKNSPLWLSKPDLQLWYNASRDWARKYFPDVLLGVYSDEELAQPAEIPPKSFISRTEQVLQKVTSRPVSEGQRFEPDPELAAQAKAEAEAAIAAAPRATETQTTEAMPPDLSTVEGFNVAMSLLAEDAGKDNPAFDAAMAQINLDHAVKNKVSSRRHVYEAAKAGALDWSTGKIVD